MTSVLLEDTLEKINYKINMIDLIVVMLLFMSIWFYKHLSFGKILTLLSMCAPVLC